MTTDGGGEMKEFIVIMVIVLLFNTVAMPVAFITLSYFGKFPKPQWMAKRGWG